MASRPDLSMLQNLNRRLRTGLWQVPPQWKALRRTPGWSYHPQPVQRISVPHQHLYPLVFERLPMLRLEGHRLGEIAVNSTGSNSNSKSLTQRIVLRWWSLTQDKMNPLTLDQSFERVRKEFEPHLQQYANYLTRTKEASVSRHAQLSVAKVEKDALDQELGRPARYSEQLESLVNHALNRQPTDPHQYFSPQVSRKLIKMINRKKIRQRLTTQTETLREALDNSTLGKRSNEVLNNGSDASVASSSSSLSSSSSSANPNVNLDVPSNVPSVGPPATSADSIINSFPTDSTGEPIPSPELFFQFEKAWSTSIGKMSGRRKKRALTSIGNAKSHKVTEFTRHIDEMHAEPDAKLADYLAYVLYTQIITLQYKSLESWLPYTHYLNHRIFFHAFRLLHTSIKTSSVVTGSVGLLPKVRHLKLAPKSWSFQQALTHQRLLVLVENHLATAPLHSFKEDVHSLAEVDHDVGVVKKAALPLTPFWQEVMDEKVRIKHPGESWYNSRVQEMIDNDTLDQEAMRIEREEKMKWLEERAAAAAREEAEKAKEE